ncbi:SRPBCC family protein [Archangium sp.]|uniref:SRPBCC family protein n=1 Tax=Archangium sp. TaxID=1872627 RepID=UPI0039C8A7F5
MSARLLETRWILIDAPADVVWSTLTDFASHRTWDSYVVTWEGEAKVGGRMKLVAMADRRREFTPVVTEVVPARRLRLRAHEQGPQDRGGEALPKALSRSPTLPPRPAGCVPSWGSPTPVWSS